MKPLHALAELLAPGDTKLVAAIDAAEDPWEALGDGLETRKRLWRIDWKTFPSDVLWSFDQILPPPWKQDRTRWAWCDLDKYEDEKSTDQFLKIVGTALAARDIGVVGVDQGSDQYWITTLPFSKLPRALALAKQAKLGTLQSFSPKTKPPPPAPLPPPKKQPPTKRAKKLVARNCDLLNDKHSHVRGMIYEKGEKPEIWLAEVAGWPPKARRLATGWRASIAWGPGGTHLINGQRMEDGKQVGIVTLVTGGKAKPIELPHGVGVRRFAFVGDELFAFPWDWVFRTKAAKTPLVLTKAGWKPVPGLPKIKPPPPPKSSRGSWDFAVQGIARTAEGVDVVLWDNRGYERVGASWVARYDLGRCDPRDELSFAPAVNGFYFEAGGELRHVVRGGKARRTLPKVDRIEWICGGPDSTVLIARVRMDSKKPAGLVYLPATDEVATIPATAFSLHRDDWVEVLTYHPELDLVIGYYERDFSDATMAPVYGASLLALPRRKV